MVFTLSLKLAHYQILKMSTVLQCQSMLKVHVAAIAVHLGWNPAGI